MDQVSRPSNTIRMLISCLLLLCLSGFQTGCMSYRDFSRIPELKVNYEKIRSDESLYDVSNPVQIIPWFAGFGVGFAGTAPVSVLVGLPLLPFAAFADVLREGVVFKRTGRPEGEPTAVQSTLFGIAYCSGDFVGTVVAAPLWPIHAALVLHQLREQRAERNRRESDCQYDP